MFFSSDPTEPPSTPTPGYRSRPRTPNSERTLTPERYILDPGSPGYAPSDDEKTVVLGSSPPLPALEGQELSEEIVRDEDESEDEHEMILSGVNAEPLQPRTGLTKGKLAEFLRKRQEKAAAEVEEGPYGPPLKPHLDTFLSIRTTKPIPPAPPLEVLIVLSPSPATATEMEVLCERFCADFPHFGHVSLYQHLRYWSSKDQDRDVAWRELEPLSASAVRMKLEKGRGVTWQNGVPVVKRLVDRAVQCGKRSLIVSGLAGDKEAVAEFERVVVRTKAVVVLGDVEAMFGGREVRVRMGDDVQRVYEALQAEICKRAFARMEVGDAASADADVEMVA